MDKLVNAILRFALFVMEHTIYQTVVIHCIEYRPNCYFVEVILKFYFDLLAIFLCNLMFLSSGTHNI